MSCLASVELASDEKRSSKKHVKIRIHPIHLLLAFLHQSKLTIICFPNNRIVCRKFELSVKKTTL